MSLQSELAKIVGDERVIGDAEVLEGFRGDKSGAMGEKPELAVKPRGLDDVQKIVKLANDLGFTLVPVSSRGGRSRGGAIPLAAGSVIMDLSDMRRIIRVDKRNKVAMIEPGVTYGELQEAVEKEGLRLEAPLAPRGDKSVLAGLLDREPTTGPKYNWDAIDPLCCLELVFGTGDLFRTGNAAGPGTLEEQWAAGQAQKVSMGPAQTDVGRMIQGAQGTLGIATWATVKLEIKPSAQKGFLVGSSSLEGLIDFTYKILWRKLPDLCLILDAAGISALYGGKVEPPPWTLVYTISGLKYFPEERLALMEEELAKIASEYGVSPDRRLGGISADKLVEIVTSSGHVPYWKDAKRGGRLELFFLTTMDKAPSFVNAVGKAAAGMDFPADCLSTYLQPIRHGTGCHLEFDFMYDPSDEAETARARGLFEEAGKTCLEMGGFFSRPYLPWAKMVFEKCPDTVTALRKLKDIFDPGGVLSPGRLCFGKGA